MLTYTPPDPNRVLPTHEKPWLLMLMAFAWLWPGVFSHDLWNPSEPTVLTAVEALRHGASPLYANVFGQADFRLSPVYIWVAAFCQMLFAPWATDAYAAARFASVLFTAWGLGCCGIAGFHFLGRHHGRSVVLILIGCIGLLPMAHFLNTLSVSFAALGMILCGFSLARKQVIAAALLLGLGWTILSLSEGLLLTGVQMFLALWLATHPQWQSRHYRLTLLGAFAIALPLTTVYPVLLFSFQPQMFSLWLDNHALGAFGGIENIQTAFNLPYFLKNLLWFAFPALPLAVWTAIRSHLLSQPWGVLSAAWLVLMGILLAFDAHSFQDHLIWLLPPLALMGAAQLDGLRREAVAFLNWFGIMTFGLLAIALWIGFAAINYGWPAALAERAQYFSPYYETHIAPLSMTVALLFTPLWLWAITRKNIRGRQAVTNWAAGVTLVWALLMTLFLPWLDAAKSHAPVVRRMEAILSPELQQEIRQGMSCISVSANDFRTRSAWAQYSSLPLQIDNHACHYRLVGQAKNSIPPQGWRIIWQGARPSNTSEGFTLLEKI